MILASVAVRVLEQFSLSWIDYTSVTGGGFVSPYDLVSGNLHTVSVAFVELMLPGILVEALILKFGIQLLSPARAPYIAIALVLLMFQLAGVVVAHFIAHEFSSAAGLRALSTTSLWTLFFSLVLSFAVLVFEASLIAGVCRPRVGRYPYARFAQ